MKFKSPIYFSLLVFTFLSFSCSHSGKPDKPDVNSMTEGQVDGELSSPSNGFYILFRIPDSDPSADIFKQVQYLEKRKVFVEKTYKDSLFYKDVSDRTAKQEQRYYDSLPEKLKQEKQDLKDAYMLSIQKFEKTKHNNLPPRTQALVDRKISFIKSRMKKQLSKYDYVINHLDTIIREAKKKARESVSN